MRLTRLAAVRAEGFGGERTKNDCLSRSSKRPSEQTVVRMTAMT